MSITHNLASSKEMAESRRIEKLASDLAVFGGEHTTLGATKESERSAIISASATMQSDIQSATDVVTLQGYMATMNA